MHHSSWHHTKVEALEEVLRSAMFIMKSLMLSGAFAVSPGRCVLQCASASRPVCWICSKPFWREGIHHVKGLVIKALQTAVVQEKECSAVFCTPASCEARSPWKQDGEVKAMVRGLPAIGPNG